MICISCKVEIPSSFVMAIEANKCPGCGGEIQSPESVEFMSELAKALERMPNDPKGIAGWILSNYNISKIGDEEPPERFHRPGQEKSIKQPNTNQNDFFNRANVNINRQKEIENKIQKAASKIRGENIEVEEDYNLEEGGDFDPIPDAADMLDLNSVLESSKELNKTQTDPNELRMKRLRSQENFESGGGTFRR